MKSTKSLPTFPTSSSTNYTHTTHYYSFTLLNIRTSTNNTMSHSKNRTPPPSTTATTIVKFRLLCTTTVAGGVIGHSGSIVKRLERETSTKIQLDPPVPSSSKQRLIHIYGSPTVNRKFRFFDDEDFEVSPVQEGLVRVFDRMLEVQPPEKVKVKVICRLVVGPEVGGGDKGKIFGKICREFGANVEVSRSPEKLPPCVQSSDQVVEISGDSLAVKKAMVHVSRYMQQKMTLGITGEDKRASAVQWPSMKMDTGVSTPVRENKDAVAEVVFRLLCSYGAAGFVIGYKGKKVKALEEETAASIKFSAPDDNYNERVVTVSAFENRNMQHSSAQNALVRVFNDLMSSGRKENVSARLLIQPMQSGWLDVLRDSIVGISNATGATLLLLEHKCVHAGVSPDEKIIQIDGEYPNVQTALFQVSWMLREYVFHMTLADSNVPLLPHKVFDLPPFLREITGLTNNMKACRVGEEVTDSLPSNVQLSKFSSEACLSTSMKHPRDSSTVQCGPEHSSGKKSAIVTNTKVEIAVHADVFTSVFSEDGNNLSRIRTISGAKVEVHDPSPGGDGQVIISGTPEQTLAAQSLLQAFINAAL